MPETMLLRRLLLPELKFERSWRRPGTKTVGVEAEKVSEREVCPRCATASTSVYDHRVVTVRDAPLRDMGVRLVVRKRRFSCRPCGRPFTEPVPGIRKGYRTTERYRRSLLWACENFSDLSRVRRAYGCSSGYVYRALYTQLELERRRRLYPWPSVIGLDEHFFRRGRGGFRQFVSMVVDYKNRRLFELVEGRTVGEMEAALAHIPGRENVRYVVLDMCDPYRSFAQRFFPNAVLVADKFHVLRLLSPAINRHRRLVEGDRRSAALRRLLLCSRFRLEYADRLALDQWLVSQPVLCALYEAKEALHSLYRTRGYDRAKQALTTLTDRLSASPVPELQTLRRTLMRWRREILAYFATGLTNGRTEGFNNKAKVVKRRAYGYRSFQNYRLRLLNACA
jgi:transposase